MKKFLTLTMMLLLLCGLSCGIALADGAEIDAIVTIADQNGKLALSAEFIKVTDIDGDGKLTVNDALYCAHEQKFSGGAAAGYLSEMTEYGLSLKKLWGFDNGTGYGYYVNNAAAMSLADEIHQGDYINAFIYTDTTGWSDAYCYFDAGAVGAYTGDSFDLKLTAVGFDESYNTVLKPVEGATILVDGQAIDTTTDKDGKVTLSFDKKGFHIISAKSDSMILVPPACRVDIMEKEEPPVDKPADDTPKTGDTAQLAILAIIAVAALAGIVLVKRDRAA